MKIALFAVLLPLLLTGCLSYSDSTPARTTTVVVPSSGGTTVLPPGTTVVCTNGLSPPC